MRWTESAALVNILFMIIIGRMGSIMGSYLGAAFIVLLPVFVNTFAPTVMGGTLHGNVLSNQVLPLG